MKLLRSVLYLPATNKRAIEKSLSSLAPDAFIYDLEDSVSPTAKQEARDSAFAVCTAPRNLHSSGKVLRINSRQSPFFGEDIGLVSKILEVEENSLDAVLLAKVETEEDILPLKDIGVPTWAMLETPLGILNAPHFLPGVEVAVLGLEDLRKELGATRLACRSNIMFSMQHALVAGRSCGTTMLDGVYIDVSNLEGLRAECEQAVGLGFDGKTLIHPSSISIANEAFTPSLEEIENARKLVEAFEKASREGQHVALFNGQLIEKLHVSRAMRLLLVARRLKLT